MTRTFPIIDQTELSIEIQQRGRSVAVRVTHRPSGIRAMGLAGSAFAGRKLAIKRLADKVGAALDAGVADDR